jgi:hypothetical protein
MKRILSCKNFGKFHLIMLAFSTTMLVFLLNIGFAQTIITGGTTMKVTFGTTVNSVDQVTLQSAGTLNNQGTVILKKNLVNQNATPNSLGTGAYVFSGAIAQSITGQNIMQDLTVNNAAGLTIAGNTRVNGVLTLTNGLVSLGSNNLLLGPVASVAGTPAAANMIVATGTGELRKEYATAGSFIYPVGNATPVSEYSPVTLNFISGTFGTDNYAGVNLVNAQYSGTAISYLNRFWNVTQSGITDFSCNSTFQYVTADVVGTESDIFCFKVDPTLPWIAYNAANTATNEINAHGLFSFGTFTGNLGNGTNPPPIRSLQDKIISTGSNCADATQTLLIAGNGTSYLVQSSGSVNHIAGTNIIYYPGTTVDLGGYMHGYISTIFCNPYVHPAAAAPLISGIENPGIIGNPNNSFFKIYPNPTPGKFTLELNGDVTIAQVHVEIVGVLGDRILIKDMQIDRKQEFSLVEKPTGVYVVHVTSGLNSETEKIIKR